MILRKFFLVSSLFVCLISIYPQSVIPRFEKGERVVFVGNSITHYGYYHSYIWLYYMTRFPNEPITIMNAGVGGDVAWGINRRFQSDVLDKNPTYIALTFGMNDVGYREYLEKNAMDLSEEKIKLSFNSFKDIEKQLIDSKGINKVLMVSSPYDETSQIECEFVPGKNNAILKVGDFLKDAASENKWGYVDFNRPMLAINEREQQKNPLFALCGEDRIHPGNDGHMVMAYLFLKAQGFAGKKVAEIDIDASQLKVNISENCIISDLKINQDNGLEFNYLAKSLPYPCDTVSRGFLSKRSQYDGVKLIPFMEDFNQELLSVKKMDERIYKLYIDDQLIDEFSSKQFAEGINLAEMVKTPQYRQASEIMYLNEERLGYEKLLRDYTCLQYQFFYNEDLLFADNQKALDTIRANFENNSFYEANFDVYTRAQYPEIRDIWQKHMDEIVKKIYELAKPIMKKIKIVKV